MRINKTKRLTGILGCLLALVLTLSLATPALAVPQPPHQFWGQVTIGGSDAPDDTVVSVEIEGVATTWSTTTKDGEYGYDPLFRIPIDDPETAEKDGGVNDDEVIFKVNGDVVETDPQGPISFESGGTTLVNLTLEGPLAEPTIDFSPTSFTFSGIEGGDNPAGLPLEIWNSGTGTLDWSVSGDATWLTLSPTSGDSTGEHDSVTVSVDISGMSASDYPATITISALEATNTPQEASVSLHISTAVSDDDGDGDGGAADGEDGGGGGVPTYYVETNLFGTETKFRIDSDGEIQKTIEATSEDENLTITIPKGTIALDKYGKRLKSLETAVDESPPDPPEDAHVIGLAYDFGPDGATFDPAITLEYTYDPDALPEDVAEEDLVLAYYDGAEWVELDCVVDTENNTITASISHFTTFAIIAPAPAPPVVAPPLPAPAVFSVSNLTVQPLDVEPSEVVTITVSVANTGGTKGSYTVVLKLNGLKEAEKRATVAAGSSLDVSFSVTKEDAGSYSVTVDGLSASFVVVAPPVVEEKEKEVEKVEEAVPPPINWPVLGGVIGAVIIVALLIVFLVLRRRRAY